MSELYNFNMQELQKKLHKLAAEAILLERQFNASRRLLERERERLELMLRLEQLNSEWSNRHMAKLYANDKQQCSHSNAGLCLLVVIGFTAIGLLILFG